MSRDKKKSGDAKITRYFDSDSSKGWLDIQNYPKFKKRVSNQVPFKFPKSRDDRVSNCKT